MTSSTTAAPAVNAFEVSHSTRDRWHTVTDVRTSQVIKTFFWEDNEKFGIASVRARALSDSLWYAELIAAPEVAPEPTPEPSADMALAPSLIAIANPDQIPAALVAAAWGLAPDCQHAVNTGRQWLLTFQERPDLWRIIWRNFSESEQDAVLAGARLAGATPCELNALAGLSYAPGQDALGKPTFASLLVR